MLFFSKSYKCVLMSLNCVQFRGDYGYVFVDLKLIFFYEFIMGDNSYTKKNRLEIAGPFQFHSVLLNPSHQSYIIPFYSTSGVTVLQLTVFIFVKNDEKTIKF